MSNRPYKNVKRFADGISKDIAKAMGDEGAIKVVSVPADTDILGKPAGELTTDFAVKSEEITAVLPYVEGYTGFSSKTEEQEGNYLVFKVDTKIEDAVIKVKTSKGTYTLDEDRIIVLLIKNATGNITVTAKNDTVSLSQTYKFNLTLKEKE